MVEQIKGLCSQRNISIKALEKMLGFGNGTIRRWDTNNPSIERIKLVASFFEVPVSTITGESEQKEKDPIISDEVSEQRKRVMEQLSSLSPDQLEQALSYIEFLASNSKK